MVGLRGSPKAPIYDQFINFTTFTKVNSCLLLLILNTLFDGIFELGYCDYKGLGD
jgi:hypothetical protein